TFTYNHAKPNQSDTLRTFRMKSFSHRKATGDSGSVAKLGQCQTLQPWLSLFLSESAFFHTLTPFLPLSTHTTFLSHAHLCLFFFFPQSSQYPGQVHRAAW
uniref:Uncharacterized protein n=1 Tax=Maylandia zebra TaxID=106582 RepID=A0A3P9BVN5_9CICH